MPLLEVTKKGLRRCLVDSRLTGEPLHFHLSEFPVGQHPHTPHQHPGVEGLYLLAGNALLSHGTDTYELTAGDGVILDPTLLHGLTNTGAEPLRLLVIQRHEVRCPP